MLIRFRYTKQYALSLSLTLFVCSCVCVYVCARSLCTMCVRCVRAYMSSMYERINEFSIEMMLLFITYITVRFRFIDRSDLRCLLCITVIEQLPWCLYIHTAAIHLNDSNFIIISSMQKKGFIKLCVCYCSIVVVVVVCFSFFFLFKITE